MTDLAPFLFEKAETAPTVPAEGRFLLPLCVTEEELHLLLGAALYYAEADGCQEIRHLIPLMQAMEYIGQPEYAACMGFFEDLNEPECDNYLPYAPFADYYPSNPYNEPDFVPPDYIVPPFLRNTSLEYPELFGYKASDVFVPVAALNIAPENFLTLNYPSIKISVRGSGQIEIDLLAVQQGGLLVLKVGSPPNILDILGELIIETGVRIIDLDNDSVSIPPETDIVIAEEINIEAAVNETTDVYLVFVPKLNDSLIPLGFGGGIRSIGLCGFEQDAMMAGIEDVRYNTTTGDLEKRIDGVWTVFATCEELVACAPVGGGGGGGGGSLATKTYRLGNVGFGTITTTSTTFVDMATLTLNHTPTRANMLVMVENIILFNSAGNQPIYVRILANGAVGLDASEEAVSSGAAYQLTVSDRWSVMPDVSIPIKLQWRTPSGTATRQERSSIHMTIIEYDNASDLFVEDVRIEAGELQKKIGGVWINVTESLDARLDSITATASAALAAAAAAQTTANGAVTVNSTQTAQIGSIITVNNTQNSRLDDIDLSISGLNAQVIDHENRLDVLEAGGAGDYGGVWYQEFDFTASNHGWGPSVGMAYVSGQGFYKPVGLTSGSIDLPTKTVTDGRVTHVEMRVRNAGGGFNDFRWRYITTLDSTNYRLSGSALLNIAWAKTPDTDLPYNPAIYFSSAPSVTGFYIEKLTFLGRGAFNPLA